MTADHSLFSRLSLSEQSQVNAVCDQFEEALQQARAAHLEDFLTGTSDLIREVLLRELLVLECEYVLRGNADLDPLRLAARFPGCEALIGEVIEQARKNLALRSTLSEEAGTFAGDRANSTAFPETIGRFRLLNVLGHGSFGSVFRALDTRDGGEVALKVPHVVTLVTPTLRERFLREAQVANLDHPRIVKVREIGETGLVCYIVSEYVPGTTLARWLRQCYERQEQIPFRLAAQCVALLAEAIHHAHKYGVLHCDLKPANVLLREGAEIDPVVTDFGLARLVGDTSELTRTGQFFGTPAYMAPEQATGPRSALGPATDVYGLGAILYEMLAGRPPFQATNLLEILDQKRNSEPVSPRVLAPLLPRDLETICLNCLDKEPVRRYHTALELAEDLRRFLDGQPIKARPVGLPARVWRSCCRNPILAGLIAALVLVVSIGGGVLVNLSLQATESERRALANEKTAVAGRRQAEAAQQAAEAQHVATVRLLAKVAQIAYATPVENPDQGLTLDLLLEVEAQSRSLLAKRPEDVDLLLALGSVCLEQATRRNAHGQPEKALEANRRAAHIFQQVVRLREAAPPDDLAFLELLVDLANAQRLAQEPDAALSSARRAAAFAANTAQSPPRSIEHRFKLARSCMAVGHLLRGMGAFGEALPQLEIARQLNADLVREAPGELRYVIGLRDVCYELGKIRWKLEQYDNALAAFREAVQAQRQAFDRAPEVPAHRQQLSHFYERLAYWLRQRGCLAEASACYLEQKKLWPGNAKQLLEISGNLAELAKEVGRGRMELTPTEQEERKRYLDLSEQAAKEAVVSQSKSKETKP